MRSSAFKTFYPYPRDAGGDAIICPNRRHSIKPSIHGLRGFYRQVSVNDRLQAASCGDAAHIQTAMQVWESAEGVPKWAR